MQLFLFSNFLISCSPKAALRNIWILFWRVPETQIPNESQHLTEIPETNERKTEKPFVQSVHKIQNCWTLKMLLRVLFFFTWFLLLLLLLFMRLLHPLHLVCPVCQSKERAPRSPREVNPTIYSNTNKL